MMVKLKQNKVWVVSWIQDICTHNGVSLGVEVLRGSHFDPEHGLLPVGTDESAREQGVLFKAV